MIPMKLGRFQKFVQLDSFVNYNGSTNEHSNSKDKQNGYALNSKSKGHSLYNKPVSLYNKPVDKQNSLPLLQPSIISSRYNTDNIERYSICSVEKKLEPMITSVKNSILRQKYKSIDILNVKGNETSQDLDIYLNFLKVNGSRTVRLQKNIQEELKIIVNRFKKDNQHKKLDDKKKKVNIDDEELPIKELQRHKSIKLTELITQRMKNFTIHSDQTGSGQSLELVNFRMQQKNVGEQWQQTYAKKNKQQLIDLKACIQQFVNQIDSLMHMWKNNNRVRKYIESLLSKFQELRKIMIPATEGVMNILLTPLQIEKLFQYKEMLNINDSVAQVTKYNFSHTHELQKIYLNLQEVKKNFELQEITLLQQQLFKDLNSVKQTENKLVLKKQMLDLSAKDPNKILGINLFKESELSYFSPLMHNETKNLMLQKIEKVYGILPLLKCETREVNDVLNSLMKDLVSVKGR